MTTNDTDRLLDVAATSIGQEYGMTADEVLTHIAMGERHHGDAPSEDCGAVSPWDEAEWCRRVPGHHGDHYPWRPKGEEETRSV